MRFLLVDQILELEPGKRATGIKNVTLSEDFLAQHFPHRPIMPGVLILESMVQLVDWLIRAQSDFRQIGLASSFDRVKFRRIVRPGDQLRLEVDLLERTPEIASLKATAQVLDMLVASANIGLILYPLEGFLDPGEARRLFAMIYPAQMVEKA